MEWLKVQTSNFACGVIVRDIKPNNEKNGQKAAWHGSHDLLFEFWNPPNISGTAEDTKLKSCTRIAGKGY